VRLLALLVAGLAVLALAGWLLRATLRRTGRRALLRFRARVDRYKFAPRAEVVDALLRDAAIAQAVAQHAAASGETVDTSWARVRRYLDEIVPQFNVLAYYQLGYRLANALLAMFWKCSVHSATPGSVARLPRDAHVVYLINHRSNADYVLVAWALAGQVSISYAVGEWARAFPLEFLFKRFGSYFIRRGYREVLYHTVLERYVQHITVQGVTQGIFPEGGLTRDGRLRPGKIGLLDYLVGTGRDRAMRERLVLVPVALNYDRVLEDRTLLRELREWETVSRASPPSLAPASAVPPGGAPVRTSPPRTALRDRLAQAAEVGRFVAWNAGRALTGRWRRYGRAVVVVGDPIPLAGWFAEEDTRAGGDLFALPRDARLARVQALCDTMLTRIGAIIPVTPVPLACAAIQSLDASVIPRTRLLERMEAMRDVLLTLNGSVLRADRDIADTFDIAYRLLRLRRVLSRHGDSYVVLERGRELVSYYANSVAHLLGEFEAGVRARDALPVERALGSA
jgi:glycerol-3-phosphate O-acyltransferase